MMDDYTFLYVEDDPLSQQALEIIFTRMLTVKGFHIFGDSENFIKRVKALPELPDFILMDIHLKPYSGIDLLDMLRADPELADIKVIAFTASVMSEEVALLKQSGFDGGVGKPIDVLVFPKIIEQIVKGDDVWHMSGN